MSNRKNVFFTSDWHLGHEKAIEYDERPFKNCDHMAEVLVKRFNATVVKDAVTYFLGDMGNKNSDIKPVIERLNGTKVLIVGNHDKGYYSMYNCGFDVVMHGATIYIGENRITLSHCPLINTFREDVSHIKGYENGKWRNRNWHGEDRPKHRACSTHNYGQFHLHGHIHSRKGKPQSKKIESKQYDVGVTANNYRPVSISEVESWINRHGR